MLPSIGDVMKHSTFSFLSQHRPSALPDSGRGGLQRQPPRYGIAFADRHENRTGMPDALKSNIEALSGVDVSDVRVHRGSSKPAQINAQAYAQGRDIHLGPGQDHHLAHEAWHLIQQRQGRVAATQRDGDLALNTDPGLEREADTMGARASQASPIAARRAPATASRTPDAIVQGYFEQAYTGAGNWLQTDDLSVVAKKTYPNHELYAKAGKAAAANLALQAVNSGIELIETGTSKTFREGSEDAPKRQATLKKIEAKNKQNNTQGNDMLLWADCGKSNAVVVGGSSRQASYELDGAKTAPGGPTAMKMAIMKAWLKADTSDDFDILMASVFGESVEDKLPKLLAEWRKAQPDKKEAIAARYSAKLDEAAEEYWKYYNELESSERDKIDKALKINRYASPDVGQGFTISSGGASAGKATWNFHWGGVVMTSDDNSDKVVLENYAVGDPSVENKLWTFDIYGSKKDQTFHERHQATKQHGMTPTTMTIEKKP